MTNFVVLVFGLFNFLLTALEFVIIGWAILSWLVAFDVVNMRNRFVYAVTTFLDRIVRPVLYPLQRMIPPIGGMDITPIIALLLLQFIQGQLLPRAANAVLQAIGGA